LYNKVKKDYNINLAKFRKESERYQLTKAELFETLASYSDDTELAVVWFDKEEIDEEMSDSRWSDVCNNLITSDEMLEAARRELLG
jgi:hypothetical protein